MPYFGAAEVLLWETREDTILAHPIDDDRSHSQEPLMPVCNPQPGPPASENPSVNTYRWQIRRIKGKISRCFSPTQCNKRLSRLRHGRSHHGGRNLQSAQSKDLMMTDFVNMRAPTNKVALNKHTAAQMMTHFSREYGFIKFGVTPGGGGMLGAFAHVVASAISSNIREFRIQLRGRCVKSDPAWHNASQKGSCTRDSKTQVEYLHVGLGGTIAYFNRPQGRAADNWTWPKPRSWPSSKTGFWLASG